MWSRLGLSLAVGVSWLSSSSSSVAAAGLGFGLDEWLGPDLAAAVDAWFAPIAQPPTETQRFQLLVLDLSPRASQDPSVLSDADRRRACEVAVGQLQSQWKLQQDLAQLRQRLRQPFLHAERLSVVQLDASPTCEDLDRPMRDACEQFRQQDTAIRRIMHKGTTSPAAICTQWVPTSPEPLSCKLCKRFVQMIVKALTKDLDQVEQVREILGDICEEMPADSMCHTFLQRYDDIVAWLKAGTDPAYVCPKLYMCPETEKAIALENPDDKTCWFCDEVTTILEVLVQEQPDKVDVIREYADLICKMLGDPELCQKYDTQLDYIVDALKQRQTPREICKHLKYCQSSILALAATEQNQQMKAMTFSSPQSFHSCFYCVHISSVVRFVLTAQPKLVDTVRRIVEQVCQWAPKDCQCDTYVKNFDKVMSLLKDGKSPLEVCKTINMCKKQHSNGRNDLLDYITSDRLAEEVAALVVPTESINSLSDMKCVHCHFFATLIEIAIQERPEIMDEVREYADMICGLLGENSPCHKYVKQIDYIVDEVEKGKKPGEICVALHYCSTTKSIAASSTSSRLDMKESALKTTVSSRVAIDECFFCTTLGRFIKIAIEQNPDEVNQIRVIADLICRTLPGDNKCHAIVRDMDTMIDSIRKGEDPGAICHDLHYCTKRVSSTMVPALPPPSVGTNKCAYCDGVVTILKYVIHQNPDAMENLREAAGIVCEMMPEGDQCHVYLSMYDSTLDALKDGKSPHAICKTLKYCDQTTKLVGSGLSISQLHMKNAALEATLPRVNVDNCFYCTMLGRFIKIAIEQKPDAVNQIRVIADLICTMLPADNKCHEIVYSIDKMIDSVRKGKDPVEVCHDLNYCTKRASSDSFPSLPSPSVGSNQCAYCDGIVTVLKYAIQQRPDEMDELREAAGIVCGMLPKDDECHEHLKMYDTTVKELKDGKTPHVICQDLKFCKASSIEPFSLEQLYTKATEKTDKSMSVGCLFCEYIAEILKHIHLDPKQQAQAKQALESMCTILPPSARCDVLTSQFDSLAKMVYDGTSPSQACNKISLCDAQWVESSDSHKPFEDTFPIGNPVEVQ